MVKQISLADVQTAAQNQYAQVCNILEDLRREQDKESPEYRCYVSDRLLEEVANRLDRWSIMAQMFEAIASEKRPIICLLNGIEGFSLAYISRSNPKCNGFNASLASMYDRSIFTSLPYLEVKGEKMLLLHQDSEKAEALKGIMLEESREFIYNQWNPYDKDETYTLKVRRII